MHTQRHADGVSIGVARILVLGVAMLLVAAVRPSSAQSPEPDDAVFRLVVAEKRADGHYGQAAYGTAFLIQTDGTAVTNSHVVYRAQHDPDRFRLMGIIGPRGSAEFYDATLICASRLPYDPSVPDPNKAGVTFSRDIAEVKLAPSTFPFSNWILTFKTGEKYTIATAHKGPLPQFPTVPIAGRPQAGQQVRVVGYGHISPIPEKWTATGQVAAMGRTLDGTETFRIEFSSRAQPGNSGSPVLNDQNQVIGIWTWYSFSQSNLGWAQSSSVLEPPCR